MSDIETIKGRIRKLMAVAGDGVATDGEIDNAMRLAAKLLDAHHLSEGDVQADPAVAETQQAEDRRMGRAAAVTQTSRLSTWESVLAHAIGKLFGCVNYYISYETAPIRNNGLAEIDANGEVKRGRKIYFYGPLVEAQEAADLLQEWSRAIATMGVARWGGCFRGDGAKYCYGFAMALDRKTTQIDDERVKLTAKPLPVLPGATASTTAITLKDHYLALKEQGKTWLKESEGTKLRSAGSRTDYSAGSNEAFVEGRAHGNAAEFSRRKARKYLPGN